jgi:feruloyl esterase
LKLFYFAQRGAKPARKHLAAAILWMLLYSSTAFSQGTTPVVSCESLTKLVLPGTIITMAQPVAAGEFKIPVRSSGEPGEPGQENGHRGPGAPVWQQGARRSPFGSSDAIQPAFCRVAATLKPSSDSDIKIEIWLPLKGWNGKFFGAGSFGWGGSIMYDGLLLGVKNGYATASTDTGHDEIKDGQGGKFAMGHPEKMIDYGYRAVHEMTVKAKAIMEAFYGVAPQYSYFLGCSLGGMEAMVEARRFPEDYNGIVAGAPANPMTLFNAAQLWPAWLISKDPAKFIPSGKYAMIHEAAMKACASPVGQKQGLIDNPERCHFDPGVLLCKGADGPDCLTAPQAELMRQIYAGPVNPRSKKAIFPGPAMGAELQLPMYTGKQGFMNALELYRSFVYEDPNWDLNAMDFDSVIDLARKKVDPIMYADPNLKEFVDRGGKLLIYDGWTDYHNPLEVAAFYNTALKNAGGKATDSIRFFMIPGMDHCFGGAGCDTFDKLGAIAHWVESGKTPERIIASKLSDGKVVRTSPLCAYPKVAQYKGTGDTEKAENFVCVELKPAGRQGERKHEEK